ncbi:hypothetical protein MSG28_010129 [Choristoneura fumiferana]|uniref:Uncharacterized protein n=1 Tax=Choristoneura fumiferana TaxID=7141 RepID=A0ACC0KJU2_CHOFU|nr:hypothetical protein MSG28_010129 [Choristoneura fumiferana]
MLIDEQDEEVKKQLPVVPKCCESGQNLTVTFEDGKTKTVCSRSRLTFQPLFHKANDTHIWSYDSNVFETIVRNPCNYDSFRTCCLLSFIMGLSWVLEVVSWAAGAGSATVSVWSVFDLINALQGVVIFGIFVLQQPVRSIVKSCRRKRDGSEVSVVSERNSLGSGRRDYV